jgi:hypothetical protein
MRKIFFLMFVFFIFDIQGDEITEGRFVERDSDYFILNLPYEIGDDVKYIFHENTPLAIDIIEIKVDGETLSVVDEFDPGEADYYFHICEVIEGQTEYFIGMRWYPSNPFSFLSGLRWYDGRGMIYTDLGPNCFSVSDRTNTYEILRGMEILEIRYRIVLPYPTLNIDNLRDREYENKRFTEEYRIIVRLTDVFSAPIKRRVQ